MGESVGPVVCNGHLVGACSRQDHLYWVCQVLRDVASARNRPWQETLYDHVMAWWLDAAQATVQVLTHPFRVFLWHGDERGPQQIVFWLSKFFVSFILTPQNSMSQCPQPELHVTVYEFRPRLTFASHPPTLPSYIVHKHFQDTQVHFHKLHVYRLYKYHYITDSRCKFNSSRMYYILFTKIACCCLAKGNANHPPWTPDMWAFRANMVSFNTSQWSC